MSAEVRIGTSGWHYKHWCGPFYPEKQRASGMLDFYLRQFDTVELNNSFYRLPSESAFECWRQSTPPDFVFAVKASRFITHRLKLKNPANALHNFLPPAEKLREKLGPVLFQLPPNWRVNPQRLEAFLAMLPSVHRYAFEFRDPSWHTQPIYDILQRYNAAFCIFDIARFHSPMQVTADFTYVRLHGPGDKYQGSYSREALTAWARQIAAWSRDLKAIYVYFDNDQAGYAARNALELKRRVDRRTLRAA